MEVFDGKKIRDEIIKEVADKVVIARRPITMAVILVGNDPVSEAYIELKKKIAIRCGVQFCLYKFEGKDTEKDVLESIEFLNSDPETDGIMIQIPVPKGFDRDKLIGKISPEKDIDGLRFCAGLDSKFKPPVVLAILEAITRSNIELKNSKIAVIGRGFLVGDPLLRTFKEMGLEKQVTNIVRENKEALEKLAEFDIIITAAGSPHIIKSKMVKEGAVLIDAGTTEDNGQLVGDINPDAYKKAAYYTPVPGGIGPVTAAMLFKNLIS